MNRPVLTFLLCAVSLVAACTVPTGIPSTRLSFHQQADEAAARALVEQFGQRLQDVWLTSPEAAQQVRQKLGDLVAPDLIEQWTSDTSKAPGRLVSSPWPARIEITSLRRESPDSFVVEGFKVEVTSVEASRGEGGIKTPVRIVVQRQQGRWLITEYAERGL
ncbi:MAG: hypothetical protein RMM31_02470 [Anaerolineae bacterium]|nr:hypothetical protein [Thermoflexales bacterium]MDW8395086.1 hypothetical protein [Anaerolineae bacterium]